MLIFMSPLKIIGSEFKFKPSKTYFNELIKLVISTDGDLCIHNKTNVKLLIIKDSSTMLFS